MPKKDPNKPKGRKTAYAFFVQETKESDSAAAQLGFTEFSKHCSNLWKKLDDEKKQKYYKKQEEDKKRHDREMADYKPPEDDSKGKRKKKDKSLPKRAMSGFMFFSQEERPKVKKDNPDASLGDIAKILGKKWNSMSDDNKRPYEVMAQRDRERYEEEMQQLKVTGGKPGRRGAQQKAAPSKRGRKPTKKTPARVEEEDDEDEEEEEEDDDEEEEEDSSD